MDVMNRQVVERNTLGRLGNRINPNPAAVVRRHFEVGHGHKRAVRQTQNLRAFHRRQKRLCALAVCRHDNRCIGSAFAGKGQTVDVIHAVTPKQHLVARIQAKLCHVLHRPPCGIGTRSVVFVVAADAVDVVCRTALRRNGTAKARHEQTNTQQKTPYFFHCKSS